MKFFDKLFKRNNKSKSEKQFEDIWDDVAAEILDEKFREALNEFSNSDNGATENFKPKGNFGYEKSNPIMTKGISQGYRYLDKLVYENGDKITYNRIGSFQRGLDDLSHPMDGYTIINELTGVEICTLYIYPYSHENSTKAPEGFQLKFS